MNILNENKYAEIWEILDKLSPAAGFVVTVIHMGKILAEMGDNDIFGEQDISVDDFETLFIIFLGQALCFQSFYLSNLLQFSFLTVRWQDILFCNFWFCAGLCELQMCLTISAGFYFKIISDLKIYLR